MSRQLIGVMLFSDGVSYVGSTLDRGVVVKVCSFVELSEGSPNFQFSMFNFHFEFWSTARVGISSKLSVRT